ncbi:zinc finger protein 37-like isoform X1 [Haliotis rubra]|uniref:zinc finger protein 37-like isoform X1 n=1 Tax=Haliotis rubra TaxID=36100 RepID=UPI001EE5CCCA|nr:zinc finger protein 37-like isoform X1 [Haliotis rubra]XP_046550915.1 zinc finger protein 37-like isoform X1 [Haliotis rubra]
MMCMGVPALNYAYMNMMRNPNSALAHLAENQVNPNLETQIRNHIGENSLISVLHTPDGKVFRCNLCAKSFTVWTELEIHLRTHAGESTATTGHMTQVFNEEGETTFGCNLCEKKFKVWGHLQAHIRSHTNVNKDKGHVNLQNHVNIQNQNQNPNQNPEMQNLELRDNVQKSQNEPKMNINQANLSNGENILQKLSIFMCNVCTKTFKTREQLQEHGKQHNHNLDGRKEGTCMNIGTDPMDISFDCNLCARTFSARELFQDHMKSHVNDRAALYMMYTPDKECPYKCNFCGETFKVMMNLQNHIKTHMLNTNINTTKIKTEKQFKCTECKKSYDVWGHLQAHMKKHTGESKSAAQLVEGQIPFQV